MARISPGTMTAAIFAILVGLAGAYAVRQYLNQPPAVEPELVAQPAPRDIVVPIAGSDLIAGRTLDLNDVVVLRIPPEQFAQSKYVDIPFMRDTRQIEGRMLRDPVKKGEPFLTTSFYPVGMEPGVAELLRPGFRAVTVPIENVGAVEGYARPGSMVDVLFRSAPREGYAEMTMTLLERVEVLAVGKVTLPGHRINVGGGTEGQSTVTLAVTPPQAKALKVVEGRGALSMSLRNPDDNIIIPVGTSTEKVTLEQLLDLPPQPTAKKMDIYLGSAKTTLIFENEPARYVDDRTHGFIKTPIAGGDTLRVDPPTRPVSAIQDPTNPVGAGEGGGQGGSSGR